MAEEERFKWTFTRMVVQITWQYKFKAVCKLCDKEIQVANNGCFAFMQHTKQNMYKQKAVVQNISEKAKTYEQVVVASTSTSEPKPSDVT